MNARIAHGWHALGMSVIVSFVAAWAVTSAAADTPGPTVALHLTQRFGENAASCVRSAGGPPLPVVLCSGILLRTTRRGPGYDAWNPNPSSPTPNGVPFSWLRQDATFDRLAFGQTNGFVILPYFYADTPSDGYTQLTVRCVFPFDGATNVRTGESRDGCGASTGIAGTGPCQAQGIISATQWMARFGAGRLYGDQCGFRLLPGTAGAWEAFQAHWQIRQLLPSRFSTQNEVIVATWAQGDRRIPLEAFFYLGGDAAGLGEARANQVDFKARTGRWVPVIQLTLPATQTGSARFVFNTDDQGIAQ